MLSAFLICESCSEAQIEPSKEEQYTLLHQGPIVDRFEIQDLCFAQHDIEPDELKNAKTVSRVFAPCFWSQTSVSTYKLVGRRLLRSGEVCQVLDGFAGKTFDTRWNNLLLHQCHLSEIVTDPVGNEDQFRKICVLPFQGIWSRIDQAYFGNLFADYGFPVDRYKVSETYAELYISKVRSVVPFDAQQLLDDLQPNKYRVTKCEEFPE